MSEAPLDNRALLRRTLITVGAMVGGCVVFVGSLTLAAAMAVGRSVAAAPSEETPTATAPAATIVRPPSKGPMHGLRGPKPPFPVGSEARTGKAGIPK